MIFYIVENGKKEKNKKIINTYNLKSQGGIGYSTVSFSLILIILPVIMKPTEEVWQESKEEY